MSKYQKGDKVVIRKDLILNKWYGDNVWSTSMKKYSLMDYVELGDKSKRGFLVGECFAQHRVTDEMIAGLYEESSVEVDTANEDTKYLWMSDEFECGFDSKKEVLFLFKNNRIHLHFVSSDSYKEILKGDYPALLLTESEAKKHYLFKSVKRVEVEKEDLYYVCLKCSLDEVAYLNQNQSNGSYFMSDCDEEAGFKTKFTTEECNKIIGTSEILYKELVK